MKKTQETYEYKWPNDSCRNAAIVKDLTSNIISVKYNCLKSPYDQDDWQFIHDLSKEVLRLFGQG